MIDPVNADHHEADNVAEISRPLRCERKVIFAWGLMRNFYLQDQQGDGDGEHAVAEGFEARSRQRLG